MNHSLPTLSSGVKFLLTLAHYMTVFEFQFLEAKRFFTYPWFQFVRIKISKKTVPTIFDYVFTFWDIGLYLIFASFEISTKSRKSFVTSEPHIFLKNRYIQRLFPQFHTVFKGIAPKIFIFAARALQTYREASKRIYNFLLVL